MLAGSLTAIQYIQYTEASVPHQRLSTFHGVPLVFGGSHHMMHQVFSSYHALDIKGTSEQFHVSVEASDSCSGQFSVTVYNSSLNLQQ